MIAKVKNRKISLLLDYHLDNAIFKTNDPVLNRDNCLYPFALLKDLLGEHDIDISTCDISRPEESDLTICFDYPEDMSGVEPSNAYLFLFESEVIKPLNVHCEKKHAFKRVYTWNDALLTRDGYHKFNFSQAFPSDLKAYELSLIAFENKKLCALVSGNKSVSHPLELYSERLKTIRWFEANHPENFDLYGVGWDQWSPSNGYLKFLSSKVSFVSNLFAPKFSCYKGKVASKKRTLSKYKFAICYENAQKIPGYITEKIFDCFFAGCVPVYWGAPNITDHIPKECFIDRRDFSSHEELYGYLENMCEKKYLEYQENITDFIFSTKADPYRAETFANTIVEQVLNDI